jgi:arginine deiminase
MTVISTGLDPPAASRQQWDDGGNTLVIAPRLVVSHERNTATHARLAGAGIEVIKMPGSELSSGRGGPRCMSCPVSRDLLAVTDEPAGPARVRETRPDTAAASAGSPTLVPAATSALG